MSEHTTQWAAILGNHPELSLLELQRVLEVRTPNATVTRHGHVALIDGANDLDPVALMDQLGGSMKIIEMVGPYDRENFLDWLFEQMDTETKFHYGFSHYGMDDGVSVKEASKRSLSYGLKVKRELKNAGISARFVEARESALSSVIVHKERLLKNGVDVCLFHHRDGSVEYGVTRAVQPFQDFSKRDYGRPGRDSKSGMLPPKVARMMVNIAAPTPGGLLLDPFCGSGTVVQESLLLGHTNVMGTDKAHQAIGDTKKNLAWLKLPAVPLTQIDVRKITSIVEADSVETIVAEGYLGPPTPKADKIGEIVHELNEMYASAIRELAHVVKTGGRLVVALPAWRQAKKKHRTLSLDTIFADHGFTPFHDPLFYGRPSAKVLRHIHFYEKK